MPLARKSNSLLVKSSKLVTECKCCVAAVCGYCQEGQLVRVSVAYGALYNFNPLQPVAPDVLAALRGYIESETFFADYWRTRYTNSNLTAQPLYSSNPALSDLMNDDSFSNTDASWALLPYGEVLLESFFTCPQSSLSNGAFAQTSMWLRFIHDGFEYRATNNIANLFGGQFFTSCAGFSVATSTNGFVTKLGSTVGLSDQWGSQITHTLK